MVTAHLTFGKISMKIVVLLLSALAFGGCAISPPIFLDTFGGCANNCIPTDRSAQMVEASRRFDSITFSMTKGSCIALLGAPQKEEDQRAFWDVRIDEKNFEALSIEFNVDGHIAKITRTQSWQSKTANVTTEKSHVVEMTPSRITVGN